MFREEQLQKILVATFGFDIDFVVRRIIGRKYDQVKLLSLKTKEGEERVAKAFHALKTICLSMKIDCTLELMEPVGLVRSVYTVLKNASASGQVDLFLTGGPRLLVVSSLFASLMLGEGEAENLKIVVEGEAFEHSWEPRLSLLKQLLKMDDRDRDIIMTLRILEKAGLAELTRRLNIPKPTVFRRLSKLASGHIVCFDEKEDLYYLCKEIHEIL